jgi:MFS family permease
VFTGFALLATAAMLVLPATGRRAGVRYRPAGFTVPRAIVGPFARACFIVIVGWGASGIYLVLGPSMLVDFLGTPSHSVAGATLLLFFGAGAFGAAVLRRRPLDQIVTAALVTILLGLAAMSTSVWVHGLALYFIGAVCCGAANGISMLAGLTIVNAVAPSERRAGTISAYFLAAYSSVALSFPVIGWAADRFGLDRMLYGYAAVFGLVALLALVEVLTRNASKGPA